MEPIHVCNKGHFLNALEEFEIYKASKVNKEQLLNDQLSFKSNKLYDTALIISLQKSFLKSFVAAFRFSVLNVYVQLHPRALTER